MTCGVRPVPSRQLCQRPCPVRPGYIGDTRAVRPCTGAARRTGSDPRRPGGPTAASSPRPEHRAASPTEGTPQSHNVQAWRTARRGHETVCPGGRFGNNRTWPTSRPERNRCRSPLFWDHSVTTAPSGRSPPLTDPNSDESLLLRCLDSRMDCGPPLDTGLGPDLAPRYRPAQHIDSKLVPFGDRVGRQLRGLPRDR